MKLWKHKIRDVYSSLEELQSYDEIYNIAARLGYENVIDLWRENPIIGGTTDPKDFRVISKREKT